MARSIPPFQSLPIGEYPPGGVGSVNIETWVVRAERSLVSARLVLDGGDPDRALSTAYYAMFYAARVALIHVGQPERAMGKTHSGMIAAFNQFVVHPGLVDSRFGKQFSLELNRRIFADYEESGVNVAEAVEAIASANAFVAAVKRLIGHTPA